MPELAEVAYACSLWNPGIGLQVEEVICHPKSRVYRELGREVLEKELGGAKLTSSATHGKQMLFGFSGGKWMGLHLGMTGWLSVEDREYEVQKHDALVLRQSKQVLVFRDPRQFGKLSLDQGKQEPDWWRDLPPSMSSEEFTLENLKEVLKRHSRQPIKALLLDQRYFPGMGNWMADEVLWRSGIHPAQKGGDIKPSKHKIIYKQIVFVAEGAMESVGKFGGDPPEEWLFHVRWKDGLLCPKTGEALVREKIGGRTTCWSPGMQNY